MSVNLYVSLFAMLMINALSCSPKADSSTSDKSDSINSVNKNLTVSLSRVDSIEGAKVFESKCMICHQPDGNGISALFPPLAGSDYLLVDKQRALRNIRHGFNDSLTVNGIIYKKYKMPVPEITDQQLAYVMNYILNSWGNRGGLITLADITATK